VRGIVNRVLIGQDSSSKQRGTVVSFLKQVKPVLGAWRAMFSSPNFLANLEKLCNHLEVWRLRSAPPVHDCHSQSASS